MRESLPRLSSFSRALAWRGAWCRASCACGVPTSSVRAQCSARPASTLLENPSAPSTWETCVAIPTRDPVVRYLLLHAAMLRRPGMQAAAERLDEHARALVFLADYVRKLGEDDERLLQL